LTRSGNTLADRIERIQDKIHQRLNKLGPVANDSRERGRQIKPQSDVFQRGVRPDDAFDIIKNLAEVDRGRLHSFSLKERPNISDGFSRSGVILDNVLDGGLYLLQVRPFRSKQTAGSLRVTPDCCERLVQFMSQ